MFNGSVKWVHHLIGLAVLLVQRTSFHPLIQLPGPVPFSFPLFIVSVPQWTKQNKTQKRLPPRGVARINKLQGTLKNLDKIYSDRLKYCHDHKYHFQMLQLQGQESRSGNLIQASHMEGYCQARVTFWYLNISGFISKRSCWERSCLDT